MKDYQVVWKGPVQRSSGLGIASREYSKALQRQGVMVTTGAASRRTARKAVLVYHFPPHMLNMKLARKQYDRVILNTVWETTMIPKRWRASVNRYDAVFVPSIQNKDALRKSGTKVPVYRVPHGVHAHLFTPQQKSQRHSATSPFIFLSVFGFQHRKNPEALLRAYWEQFSSRDPVHLIIKTNGYASHENEKWIRNRIEAYKRSLHLRKSTAPLTLITRHLNPLQMKQLYGKSHAFVLPTRGEGVGMPFLEAMASGIPVIATGWGGHMDFLTNRNAFLVNYRLENPASRMNRKSAIGRSFGHLFAEQDQRWAEPDIKSLRLQMKKAFDNPSLCRVKGRQARRDSLRLSWDRAGRQLKHAIDDVVKRVKI